MSTIIFSSLLVIIIVCFLLFKRQKSTVNDVEVVVPTSWKTILLDKVLFYQALNVPDRDRFEQDCHGFLQEVRVIGVKGVVIDITDRLLVASSAVIPLFGFPQWTYQGLQEVLLYPSAFDRNFQLNNPHEIITGMVGNGILEGKMILSKPALHHGFENTQDKHNVGIHEFVHLFDKLDGLIDGIPPNFQDKAYALPWIDFIKVKTHDIVNNQSDIRDYGATNQQEFFAVTAEYFFERPHLLKKKHPVLYDTLSKVFKQNVVETLPKSGLKSKKQPKRNQSCIYGSGLKYKKCCMLTEK